jgi:YYY domain-containing protein
MVIRLAGRLNSLGLILLLAGLLRLSGINWGDGHPIHPDERHVINMVSGLSWNDPNPHNFAYGSLPLYVLRGLSQVWAPIDPWVQSYDGLIILGRVVSTIAAVLTIALVFVLGRRMFGRAEGMLAAALLAVCVLHIQLSHFYTVEQLLVLGITATFWAAIQVAEKGRAFDYVLAGMLMGMSIATKLSALPLVGVLVAAHLLNMGRRRRVLSASWILLFASFVTAYLSFFVCEPFAFAEFPVPWGFVKSATISPLHPEYWAGFGGALFSQEFLRDFWEQSNMVRGISQPIYVAVYENTVPYLYQARQLIEWAMGPGMGLASLVGMAYLALRLLQGGWAWFTRNAREGELVALIPAALLVAWLLPNCYIVGGFKVKFVRYLAPLLPFWCLAAAKLLKDLALAPDLRLARAGRWAVGLVLGTSALYALAYCSMFLQPHPHTQASLWYAENAKPGARVLQEHWDETQPFQLPNGPAFTTSEFPSYDPDSASKTRSLARLLADGDYFVPSSDRIYGTILRWQERWPQTSRLYKLLFDGELGYELVGRFSRPPSLVGITLDDGAADESFVNYDHPTVLIFENRGKLSAEALAEKIESPSPRLDPLSFEETMKLLPTISSTSKWASSNLAYAIVWWLAISGLGWLVFPMCFLAFSGMPDRGLGASKTLGPLLVAYLAWLTAMQGWTSFTRPWLVAILAILGLVSALCVQRSSAEMTDFLRRRWRLVLLWEGLFLLVGAVFLAIRAYNPEIYWGEKPMDFSFLNAFLRTETFPPREPWFSGALLNYYYFGFVIVAAAGKLTGTPPGVLYNLAVATIPAQVFVLTLGLSQTLNRRLWFPVLAAAMVVFLGNLAWVADKYFTAVPHHGFDLYWATSRVIPGAAIEEYPLWTFVFADLHAHMMAMPACLLTLFCGLALFDSREGSWLGRWAMVALSLGSLFVTNTWDFISYTLILGGLAAGLELARQRLEGVGRGPGLLVAALIKGGAAAGGLGATGLALFFPYFGVFHAGGTYHGPNRDGFVDFKDVLILFGQFLWIHWSSLLLVHHHGASTAGGRAHRRLLAASMLWGAIVLVVLVLRLGDSAYVTAALCVGLSVIATVTAVVGESKPRFVAAWLLLALGALLVGLADLYTIADRMNTIFKAYNTVWYMLSLSAAACLYRGLLVIWDLLSDPVRTRYGRAYLAAALGWLLATGGILSVAAFSIEVDVRGVIEPERVPPVRPTIDGTAYLRGKFPDDARGIEWLNRNVSGSATIVEAWGPSYQDFTRVCMNTGLTTVLGWDYHVLQRGQADAEIRARQRDIATIYRSDNPLEVRSLLDRYGVDYVFVGDLEAKTYGRGVLEKFEGVPDLDSVFSSGRTRIFRVFGHGDRESLPVERDAGAAESAKTLFLPSSAAGLAQVGALGLSAGDTLHALDWRTGELELYSRAGQHVRSLTATLNDAQAHLQSISVRRDGRILGVDTWNHRILEIDPQGTSLKEHPGLKSLVLPSAAAWDETGAVWVADLRGNRVMRLGNPSLEVAATPDGPLLSPVALAPESGGSILVLSLELRRVYRIAGDGHVEEVFRLPQGHTSALDQYAALAIEPDGGILASDPTSGALYRFSPEAGVEPVAGAPLTPTGLAIDAAGNVFVGDGLQGGIHIIAKPLRHNVFQGGQGSEPGQVNQPRGVAWNMDGSFWVADFDNHRVQKFRRDGSFVLSAGEEGDQDGQFKQPCDVASMPDGGVAVADTWNHRVQILDSRGRFVRVFGELYGPRSLAFGADGLLYVVDTGNAMVRVYRPEGELVRQWGSKGSLPGQFDTPVGIAVGKDLVYVADVNNGRVQIFTLDGKVVGQIPVPAWTGTGSEPHLALDGRDRLIATIPTENRLVCLDPKRGEVGSFRSPEEGGRGLQGPTGIDTHGAEILISDTWNHRIQRLMNPFP